MPDRESVRLAINNKLYEMKSNNQVPDVITFAGNGEPTIHPDFPGIIDDTIDLRNKYFPDARVAVLSNSTTLGNKLIRNALKKVDQAILKLDSAINETVQAHNQPKIPISAEEIISNLQSFEGKIILQTMFIRGKVGDRKIDNTTDIEIKAWLEALKRIRPGEVQIYTVSRDTPSGNNVIKVPREELETIALQAEKLGFKTQVSA
jgi:wyosine [tRNA(Phe)-imidazoG37] synthetase (radical SAM superfamily)